MQLRFPSALLIAAAILLSTGSASQPALSQTRGAGGGIGYAKTRVGRSRILYPRLTRYRDARIMREVNRQIAAATKEFTAAGCTGKDSYFRVRSRVAYADRDIFSIYASSQYYCGGPYPTNDDNISQTFDLRTGKLVEFSGLFRNYEADKQAILRTIFGARIESAERIKASGRDTDDNCDAPYTMDTLEGTTFNYNFSGAGLQIQPSFPHVIEACADIVTIPYSKLQRFAAPDGILSRMK
ncbi:MAG TPA: hypothetical protein VF543_21780 [Pyrinomonadaceae bacterium]